MPREDINEPMARGNPSQIKNKDKRAKVMAKLRTGKKKDKRKRREENQRQNLEAVTLGEEAPRKKPRTQENTRIDEPTFVKDDDEEVWWNNFLATFMPASVVSS